jgi:carbamoyltransferase
MDSILDYVVRVYRDWAITVIPSHHVCHAANVFYASGYDRAFVLVTDGTGSLDSNGKGVEVETLYYCEYPAVFNVLYRTLNQWVGITKTYSTISALLGIHPMDNGKTMGLAAHGRADAAVRNAFEDINSVFPDNRTPMTEIRGPEEFVPGFGVTTSTSLDQISQYLQQPPLPLNGLRSMPIDDPRFQRFADIAYMAQRGSSDALLDLLRQYADFAQCNNLCFSGGHAHNCLLNYEIVSSFDGINLFPDPIASDDGLSIGAAKLVWYRQTKSMEKHPLTDIFTCGLPFDGKGPG